MGDLRKRRRTILIVGSLLGGGASAAIFFLLDVMFAGMQQGTWRDAIAHDLNNLFGASLTVDSIAVYIAYVFIFSVLVVFGAFIGIVFCLFLHRFFSFLRS